MKQSLRILFVNRMVATERGGGETFDLEIARYLVKLGCEVTFLSNIPIGGRAKLPVPNAVFIRSPMFPWFPWDRVRGGWRIRVSEFWVFEKLAARWTWRRRHDFDVIQVCELPIYVASLQKMAHLKSEIPPIVLRLTAPNVHDPRGAVTSADALIASGTSIEKIKQRVRADVYDIPNGVDVERFSPEARGWASDFRSQHGIPEAAPILLYVARYQAFKNHRLLLEAFSLVLPSQPQTRLVLVGSGPLRMETEAHARRLGLDQQIVFMGEVPYDELPQVYAAADIMVISSEYESFCFAAIEAMASGLPVVTTDCGWVPKLIGDTLLPIDKQWVQGADVPGRFEVEETGKRIRTTSGGMVVSRTEPESLSKAILMMLGDLSLRQRCGTWNRAKAERDHGWNSSATKLLEVYKKLITADFAGDADE